MSFVESRPNWMDAHIGFFDWRQVLRADRLILVVVLLLAVIGLMNLYSTDHPLGNQGTAESEHTWLQLRNLAIATSFAIVVLCFDYRFLVSLAPFFYGVALALLLYVEIKGHVAKGSQRWIDFGVLSLQPSELSKVAIIYMLAWYLHKIQDHIRKITYFILAFVIVGVPGLLILIEPNLGTALTLGPITLAMLYVAGARVWHIGTVVLIGAAGVTTVLLQASGAVSMPKAMPELDDYQMNRVRGFLYPETDPTGVGWHATQTKLAIGSGELLGRGYRRGIQTHLKYVPEYHTDSIFVVLAEENGFVGCVVVLGLFAILFLRGLYLARGCPEMSGVLLGVGCITLLAFHLFVNIAITLGLMPVTGLPLPFLSYAGSFYITVMLCVGSILSINVKRGVFSH